MVKTRPGPEEQPTDTLHGVRKLGRLLPVIVLLAVVGPASASTLGPPLPRPPIQVWWTETYCALLDCPVAVVEQLEQVPGSLIPF